MNPWDPVPYSVTPAAQVLARCVTSGVVTQEELDAVPRESHTFSQHLLEGERVVGMKNDIDKKSLEIELLKMEKQSADITHSFYLSRKFTALQRFSSHLQELLREQTSLRQRLMKPLCQQHLPVEAHLHRYVVELIDMVIELIENLDSKMKIIQMFPTVDHMMSNLNNTLAQLLSQVAEVEELSTQVLHWKDHHRRKITSTDPCT